jgi:GWxTD domain-containing protein
MSVHQRLPFAVLVVGLLCVPAARAEKLSKENKNWLKAVSAIILPDEEKQYEDLKKSDRKEFEKIFWARRDPDLGTPENEFKQQYDAQCAEADQRFRVVGRPGCATDCGRVFLLLGEPDEVDQLASEIRPGRRAPQVWTYMDREGFTFRDGKIDISFDDECSLPRGTSFAQQLDRVAEAKILNPNLGYKLKDGRLVKLVDQLPKPSPAQTLLETPRKDFPLEAETDMILRSPDGAAYVAGLLRGSADGMDVKESGGQKTVKLLVAAQGTDAEGKVSLGPEREAIVPVDEDGSFTVSFGLTVRSGEHTLTAVAVDPKSGKGAATTVPVKTPDYSSDELTMSSLLVLRDIQETAGQEPDSKDSMADFALTGLRLVPRFGNVFDKSETLTMLCAMYGGQLDPETGKPSLQVSFAFHKDGKLVARAEDQLYENENPSHSVGPVPLTGFSPGTYKAEIKVKDKVADKEYVQDAIFEIKGEAEAEPEAEPAAQPEG